MATVTKVTATTSTFGWGITLAGFGAVVWRQVRNVFHHRTRYMAALAEYLYFHGLDNDRAAEAHLRDALDTDFDVHGGVDKLLELGLFLKAPDGQLVAQDPVEAFRTLDGRWDRRFDPDESATPHA